MKTCQVQGPAQENLKKESKMNPSTKVHLVSESTIWHFWSAEWHPFGLWPNSLRVPIRHILFNFFVERLVPIRILLIVACFLSILVSINRGWILKLSPFFYTLRETPFHTIKSLTPFLVFSLKLEFLGFKDSCIKFFEP